MSNELGANTQVVEVAAYLHDITKMVGERKNHHTTGAEYAYGIISKLKRSWDKIEFEYVKEELKEKYQYLLNILTER